MLFNGWRCQVKKVRNLNKKIITKKQKKITELIKIEETMDSFSQIRLGIS